MELFVIRGFETSSFSTHTMFYATSMESAKRLAEEFYDKIAPIYWENERLEDLNSKHINEQQELKRTELAKAKQEWEDFVNDKKQSDDDDSFTKSFRGIRDRIIKWQDYYVEELPEYSKFRYTHYQELYPTLAFSFYETKEQTIKNWLEFIQVINTDVLAHESYTDGD